MATILAAIVGLLAGGVIWTAYDVASANAPSHRAGKATPAVATDATGMSVDRKDIEALANAMGN